MTQNDPKPPIFGITYGRPKVGKTLALIRAFPTALFISLKGAMNCASWLDIDVPHIELDNVDQMIKALASKKAKNYPAIILDDANLQLDREYLRIKAKAPSFKGNDQFNDKVFELRDASRDCATHVFWNMHEQAPRMVGKKEELKKVIPGTVLIQGWQLPEKLPAFADFLARVVYDDDAVGWPYVYQTSPDPDYITGDRLNISPGLFPLNIGELMRSTGYTIPRVKGMIWMDKTVEALANGIEKAGPDGLGDYLKKAAKQLMSKHNNQKHVRWALADAQDRVNLRRYQEGILETYLETYQ